MYHGASKPFSLPSTFTPDQVGAYRLTGNVSLVPNDLSVVDGVEGTTINVIDAFDQEEVTYKFVEGGVEVRKYNGSASSVVIPEQVMGLTVVRIGDSAFEGNTTLTSIDLPDTIQVIGQRAFAGCTNLSDMH